MHTQPSQANKYEWTIWNDARHKIKRESKSQGIKCKQQDMFRGSSTQLYIPAFTQKDFNSTSLSTQDSHTGNLHWGFGATTTGSTQLLSQPNTTSHRDNTNTTSHKRGRHLAKQPQSTSSLRGIQIQHQLHLSLEGAIHNLNFSPEGANHHSTINLYQRGIPQIGRVYN